MIGCSTKFEFDHLNSDELSVFSFIEKYEASIIDDAPLSALCLERTKTSVPLTVTTTNFAVPVSDDDESFTCLPGIDFHPVYEENQLDAMVAKLTQSMQRTAQSRAMINKETVFADLRKNAKKAKKNAPAKGPSPSIKAKRKFCTTSYTTSGISSKRHGAAGPTMALKKSTTSIGGFLQACKKW
mmetsp:Transcript_12963/g.30721  ORF Transcript_12963/g.30721 Transcript_12963/m.30721 type:complete len:184 (+) Transcript_12963:129-680(+)|eukprot:CAMPEP_0113630714 /NCGR_PEP_ID=MMETSP0017_2-20120614/15960_1 /TAXON_ID=2856 /ORGANISM="Cylindrotheca closterium" /LENGTH=183 /DNA_ID=CAMNT_0000541193 /DNA_START=42 /DNA_END=593 /DNA_ORIENTATION=- /assembly_acc=CAM_ASM_000147